MNLYSQVVAAVVGEGYPVFSICEELEEKLCNAQEQDLLRSVTTMGNLL